MEKVPVYISLSRKLLENYYTDLVKLIRIIKFNKAIASKRYNIKGLLT